MAEQLAEMMGMPLAAAQALLEAAGGDLETATALALDGGAAGFGADAGGGGDGGSFKAPFDWYTLAWPAKEPIPAAWLEQGIGFDGSVKSGIVQPKNGPCGILSVLQGMLWREMSAGGAALDVHRAPTEQELGRAIAQMLAGAASLAGKEGGGDSVALCRWKGDPGGDIDTERVPGAECERAVAARLADFTGRGGVVLLLYSGVLTRGVAEVRGDIQAEHGDPPLVLPPWHVCSSEMIGLFLRGKAGGNVGAYTAAGVKHDWAGTPLGMLSFQELEAGIPLCDSLKSPPAPIWLVHGGDHFTTLCCPSGPPPAQSGATFELLHWNGLPPCGPRLARLSVTAPEGPARPAPAEHKETFVKRRPGEIEGIVQARPEDKKERPDRYTEWDYEVYLAVDDPDVSGGADTRDTPPEPVFDQGQPVPGPWRCAHCYHGRFKTMCFGLNEDTPNCTHCGKSRAEAGWSIWLPYERLPPRVQRSAVRMFAPKLISLLSTKWPGAAVQWQGERPAC
eukprot:TRINITY_DN33678_c0_g1_i1.p1 TRINITY_DN33678_c0_g1~~TRINITY_DN33678_c0_g1_i1.p1  ORF type:complete len:536 (+),score=131.82 TRINITY_DN33678_c0_g1_i1:89-1609(+)